MGVESPSRTLDLPYLRPWHLRWLHTNVHANRGATIGRRRSIQTLASSDVTRNVVCLARFLLKVKASEGREDRSVTYPYGQMRAVGDFAKQVELRASLILCHQR